MHPLTLEVSVGPLEYPTHRLVEPLALIVTLGAGLTVTVTLLDVALQVPHVTINVYTYVPALKTTFGTTYVASSRTADWVAVYVPLIRRRARASTHARGECRPTRIPNAQTRRTARTDRHARRGTSLVTVTLLDVALQLPHVTHQRVQCVRPRAQATRAQRTPHLVAPLIGLPFTRH